MSKANSFIQKVLYPLKKFGGEDIILSVRNSVSQSAKTGKVTIDRTSYTLKKVIVLPITSLSNFKPSQSFAVAGRQFEYGGFYGTSTDFIIVDYKTLPKDYVQSLEDDIFIDDLKFKIVKIEDFRKLQSKIFYVQRLEGQN